jgi:hypothetical protein
MENNQCALPEQLKSGVYANSVAVTYGKEEFVIDFRLITPVEGMVTARLIVTPAHIKRITTTLHDTVNKYQEQYGKIVAAEEPLK